MDQQSGNSQHSTSGTKWLATLLAGAAGGLLSVPAHAQTVTVVGSSPWVTATIVSVSAVFVLWLAAVALSGMALRLRWINEHRHSRLSRGLQVLFGALLLMAMLMPYLAMNHPLVAGGLLVTSVAMTLLVSSKNRRLQSDSN